MKECKPCNPDQICNTETGRCVLRAGQIGRQILSGHQGKGRGSAAGNGGCKQLCPPEKVCNPGSRRCVLRTGTIGRRLLGDQAPPSTPSTPSTPQREKTRWVPIMRSRQANTQPVVNASHRKTATGTVQKTPAGRKAPAGHAKNYAGKMAIGLDGSNWLSKQDKRGRWAWRRA